MGSSRTQTARRASRSAAGSASSGARTSKGGPRSRPRRRSGADALLLGRRSDEWFASRWMSRGGEWADKLNSMPKYVVSSTLKDAAWSNSTVIKGDVVSEVSKLKQEISGEILVYASYQLVHTLIEHDLVDELRLVIFPVVLGAGERLFGETSDKKPMRLVSVEHHRRRPRLRHLRGRGETPDPGWRRQQRPTSAPVEVGRCPSSHPLRCMHSVALCVHARSQRPAPVAWLMCRPAGPERRAARTLESPPRAREGACHRTREPRDALMRARSDSHHADRASAPAGRSPDR